MHTNIHVSLVWMQHAVAGVPFIDQTTMLPVKIFITGTMVSITPYRHVSFASRNTTLSTYRYSVTRNLEISLSSLHILQKKR